MGSLARRVGGFTLIELMVTVALVGVLAAIAVPSYKQWRTKVMNRQAAQDIAMMATTIKQYYTEARAYPADLTAVGLNTKLDPWGRAYEYLPAPASGHAGQRKDHALNPINTDFDLYSKGADGQTQLQLDHSTSLDDIVRANNGAFVGLSSDY